MNYSITNEISSVLTNTLLRSTKGSRVIIETINLSRNYAQNEASVVPKRLVLQIPQCTGLISHNALFHIGNVSTFLSQNGALWDICLMHCGICAMGLMAAGVGRSMWITTSMRASSNGNIFRVTGHLCVFLDMRLNKWLSKQFVE